MDFSNSKALYIDLSKIVKMTDSDIPINIELPFEAFSDNGINFASSILISGHIINIADILKIDVLLKFSINHECDRCLTSFIREYELAFSDEIAEENSSRDADEYIPYSSNRVSITDAVYKCIFSEMDIKNVCNPDCKGLCGMCGINLNEKTCNCHDDEIDPRLLKLRELL